MVCLLHHLFGGLFGSTFGLPIHSVRNSNGFSEKRWFLFSFINIAVGAVTECVCVCRIYRLGGRSLFSLNMFCRVLAWVTQNKFYCTVLRTGFIGMLTLYICITELHLLALTLFFNYIYVLLRVYFLTKLTNTHTHTDEETNTRQCVCVYSETTDLLDYTFLFLPQCCCLSSSYTKAALIILRSILLFLLPSLTRSSVCLSLSPSFILYSLRLSSHWHDNFVS